ncbi:hypothetical protein [Aliamphritea spongicola]|uniref:hypothetical protein n=1 Tax=Aliamphritea spongicola TaxID=707589 RepID=UPI00196B1944|nr:hypothetical protein [Aliamphritea spongicola]MBN3562111.1 hypothetical protein [Aliamphritea spongicola]
MPNLQKNQIAIRNKENTAWTISEDWRGTVWHKHTKEAVEHSETGPLPDHLTSIEPGEFDEWQEDKWVTNLTKKLVAQKTMLSQQLQADASFARQQISNAADILVTIGWAEKARRAERAIAGMGTAADLAALQAEATARNLGETPEQLAQLQLKKANALHLKTAIIDGWVKAAGKQVSAMADPTEAEALLISLKQNLDTQLASIS